ncbi:hypothetical protein LSTR_LSTR016942, partial [Laodelphax striatellus]
YKDGSSSSSSSTSNSSSSNHRRHTIVVSSSDDDDSSASSSSKLKIPRGKKRPGNPKLWKKSVAKTCRNSGKAYTSSSKSKREIKAKSIGPTCSEKCKLKCSEKLNEDDRKAIFKSYWDLGDIQQQRLFISYNMEKIHSRYRYVREGSKRSNNNAFYFTVKDKRIRVCKTYFVNTLAITDRQIRTVTDKCKHIPV